MSTDERNNNNVDVILKDAHREIAPCDSWEAMRARINRRLDSRELSSAPSAPFSKRVAFWRRTALAMAACFLITAGTLIYFLGSNRAKKHRREQPIAAVNNNLFDQAQLERLSFAFSQVRQLFGRQSGWIMIGSDNNAEVGLVDKTSSVTDTDKIVVVRLAVTVGNGEKRRQYYDLVMLPSQQANLRLSLANASTLNVALRPILKQDGSIIVESNTEIDDGSRDYSVSTLTGNAFTSLATILTNGNQIYVEGIGQSMSSI